MTNRYLEKIASGGFIGNVAKGISRLAIKGVKGAVNQLHLATGGGFADYAHKSLGENNIHTLSKFSLKGNAKDVRRLRQIATKGKKLTPDQLKAVRENLKNNVVPTLKHNQTDARIVSTGLAVGAGYGGKKIHDKMTEPQINTYTY